MLLIGALFIGVVYGFPGFSHLFTLPPSVTLPSAGSTILYPRAFAIGILATMILFARGPGLLEYRAGRSDHTGFLKGFTISGGLLAVGVGILWLVHPL